MPINIGGDTVNEITMDGDDVREVTIDGDVAWSALYVYAGDDGDVQKIFSVGTNVWTKSLKSSGKTQVAVDPERNIYVGVGGDTWKLNEDGSTAWGPKDPTRSNETLDIAVDANGNVFVAANITGVSDPVFEIMKFDSGGSHKWSYTQFNDAVPTGVAVGPDSDYIYAGEYGDGTYGGRVHKINQNGDRVWTYEKTDGMIGDGKTVATDTDGYVYAADGHNNELHKISSAGSKEWVYDNFDDSPAADEISSVAIDDTGIYVIGENLQKLNFDGSQAWEKTGGGFALAIDGDGDLYSGEGEDIDKRDPSDGSIVWTYYEAKDITCLAADPGIYSVFTNNW